MTTATEYTDLGDPTTYNPQARPRETYEEWAARMADPVKKWCRAEARYGTWLENLADPD